jgi:hypothetical protein
MAVNDLGEKGEIQQHSTLSASESPKVSIRLDPHSLGVDAMFLAGHAFSSSQDAAVAFLVAPYPSSSHRTRKWGVGTKYRDPSLGVARARTNPLPQDDNLRWMTIDNTAALSQL